MRPRLLDLFGCAGIGADGYAAAGFDVTSVDIDRAVAAALEQQIEREFAYAPRVRNDRDRSLLRNRLPEALARLMAPLL